MYAAKHHGCLTHYPAHETTVLFLLRGLDPKSETTLMPPTFSRFVRNNFSLRQLLFVRFWHWYLKGGGYYNPSGNKLVPGG